MAIGSLGNNGKLVVFRVVGVYRSGTEYVSNLFTGVIHVQVQTKKSETVIHTLVQVSSPLVLVFAQSRQ